MLTRFPPDLESIITGTLLVLVGAVAAARIIPLFTFNTKEQHVMPSCNDSMIIHTIICLSKVVNNTASIRVVCIPSMCEPCNDNFLTPHIEDWIMGKLLNQFKCLSTGEILGMVWVKDPKTTKELNSLESIP